MARLALVSLAAVTALAVEAAQVNPGGGDEDEPGPVCSGDIQAAPPPFSEGIFPCSQCHDSGGNATRRLLGFHEEIQGKLAHGRNWCLDCHDLSRRDVIHLSSGEQVPFTESYRLCGQCHYDKYRDWDLGIHGKRVGLWDGAKTAFLCVNCHDPHSPRFRPLRPEPRLPSPKETRR